ncbi:17375_t:CDS:2, partial [Dentiscutata heterogama]
PGVKWFNKFLKDYNLIPKYLRKLGAVYSAVAHEAKNMAHAYTIARKCLRHLSDNHTSPVQNYVVVNYCRKGQSPDQARLFQSEPDSDINEDLDAVLLKISVTIFSNWQREIEIILRDTCLANIDIIFEVLLPEATVSQLFLTIGFNLVFINTPQKI